ncbi:uncharacterized protein LOC142625350 [Castanea sativa]|uniref:uncharacterized protein LOC142625350 n=1 Tax=Castanea sativa TaxID=21020 RepID=UPI003F64A50C
MQGSFEAKDARMMEYLRLVKQTINQFQKVKVVQITRGQNQHADSLAMLAFPLTEEVPRLIKVDVVAELIIDAKANVSMITKLEPCWMSPIIDFLVKDWLQVDGKEANRVHRMAAWYWLSADHKLYRRSFGGPYLQCLPSSEVRELLIVLPKGVCGSHVGGCTLAHRAMTQGFWWPQMYKDVAEYVQKCEQC